MALKEIGMTRVLMAATAALRRYEQLLPEFEIRRPPLRHAACSLLLNALTVRGCSLNCCAKTRLEGCPLKLEGRRG
jgi:hypothetical protein